MSRRLDFGLLLMGLSFTVTQGLLIRELLVAFLGNELSIGLILGSWLVLEAIGSGLLGRLADRGEGNVASFAGLQILFALFLPLCLFAVYASRTLVGAIPGEGVGLVPIFGSSFLILMPLGLIDGAMFVFGCRVYEGLTSGESAHRDAASTVGRVYVYEAVGAIVGGLLFTYLLIPFFLALRIVLFLAALNLLAAALLLWPGVRSGPAVSVTRWIVLLLLAGSLGLLIAPQTAHIQRWALGQQWPGYHLLYSENSAYGNVAVVQREGQYTFLADGVPVLTAPVPDVAQVEEIVHLPMLFVRQPRQVLVLGGGAGGVLSELRRYPLQRIDYAELDPLLIEAVRAFPTALTFGELEDERVHVEAVDGRLLVRSLTSQPRERYDLIIVNLPYPSTLQLNRFYTAEFYAMVRGLLEDDGVLVMSCPGSLSYLSDELRQLNAMMFRTLREPFPYVRPIPGDLTLWLASSAARVETASVEELVTQWQIWGIEARLVGPDHIRQRLAPRVLDGFWVSLTGTLDGVTVNRDRHPIGLFYSLAYWNALFSPGLARLFGWLGRLSVWHLVLPLLGGGLAFALISWRSANRRAAIVPFAIATTGVAGMAADLIIIFAFQTLYGYVYHWIGLLVAVFMAGLGLGGWLMTRRPSGGEQRAFLRLELALVVYWAVLSLVLGGLYARTMLPIAVGAVQARLFLMNAVAGFLVGAQFPLANRLWLRRREAGGGAAGLIYASDLVGAFLASIAVSVFLIPVLGTVQTCLLAALLKFVSLVLVAMLRLPGPGTVQ